MQRLLILIFLFLIHTATALGNTGKYYFKRLGMQKGLSQSSVLCILQDRNGFMWFGTKDGLNRYDGVDFRVFQYDCNDKYSIGNNVINSMLEIENGDIWVGTDQGIFIYHPEQESFTPLDLYSEDHTKITQPVYNIIQTKDKNIWLSVESQGIFCYEYASGKLKHFPTPYHNPIGCLCIDTQERIWISFKGRGLYYTDDCFAHLHRMEVQSTDVIGFNNDHILAMLPDSHNLLYLGMATGGLKKLNAVSGELTDILPTTGSSEHIFVRRIVKETKERLWIATESGLYIHNLQTNQTQHQEHDYYDPYSISDNAIHSIYKDREEGMWIGSYFGGIDYYPKAYTRFEKYYPLPESNSLSGTVVREFCEDTEGNLWIGTENGGLNKFDTQTKKVTPYRNPRLYHNVHALCLDENQLWIGTYTKGLHLLDLKSGKLKQYEAGQQDNTLNENSIYSMCKTSLGDLYIGTPNGLNKYNRQTDDFTRIDKLEGIFVFGMIEDNNGILWLATYTSGIFSYNPRTQLWKNYAHIPGDTTSLPYNKVISVYEDSKKRLWFTIIGRGVCLFNPETETFKTYNTSNGLLNDVIYKIIEEKENILWLSSNKGLIRFDVEHGTFRTYTTDNGLLNNQFNYSSGIKGNDGQIYFGGISGFISFDPNSFIENKEFPPVAITDFLLFNRKAEIGNDSPLLKSITLSDKLTLSHRQNSFAFRFSALSYIASETNQLSYKLEGFDKEWYPAGNSRMATYTNLKPGDYTFCVRSANNAGIWTEDFKKIQIHIRPPYWMTSIAYIVYLIFSILSIGYLIYVFQRRITNKQRRQMELLESEKEKEIYHAKIDFFTNIAHEIRTPLTLIKGPLESVLKKNDLNTEVVKDNLQVMEKNTTRLLTLVNQLLDFRKTETKGFSLNFMEYNISGLLRETYQRFEPMAQQQNLTFRLNLPEADFYAPVDKEALTKILSNLFNNALKYALSYIDVTLHTQVEQTSGIFRIIVSNDTTPIPDEMKEEIFKPFIQINRLPNGQRITGTGIGLPLARSLAELHKGNLYLINSGNEVCFCVELPIKQERIIQLDKGHIEQINPHTAKVSKPGETGNTILLVEDEPEMMAFVSNQLRETYTVLTAGNGKEVLEILLENPVNLIVSDVMMPEMDGFELCRMLKSDITYSHIPIILLTAKADLQSKIEGIELGADAYIEKPFSIEYLLVRIVNLLTNQEKLRKAFASSPLVEAKSIALSKADESFLEELTVTIQKNISEPEFSVDTLAEQMNMSRSSLHRKIKGIAQMTPNEYIQLERLKTAAQLIRSGEYRINEVCYIVGFSSSSYFAKCFHKQFGMLPKDFLRNQSTTE